jgi:hypothetical protein
MKLHSRSLTTLFAVLLVGCMAGAVATVRKLDRLRVSASDEELYVPSGKVLRRLSLGYNGLLADIYWTRAVQYFGAKHRAKARSFPLLAPLLDITTELDPHLRVAYEFGSIFLAQPPPEGTGEPQKAVELVQRGIRENPDWWRLYYHLGYIQALELHDYNAAAATFQRGSEVPGAHPWMKVLAANMAQHGGETQTARFLWSRIYESTDDKSIRRNAEQHLRALQVDDDVQQLEALVRTFRERTGRLPNGLQELLSAGLVRRIPTDPLGRPYRLGADGHVYVQAPEDLPFIQYGRPPDAPPPVAPSVPGA